MNRSLASNVYSTAASAAAATRWRIDLVGLHAVSRKPPDGPTRCCPCCGLLSNSSADQMGWREMKISDFQYFMSSEYICNSHQRCLLMKAAWGCSRHFFGNFNHLFWEGKRTLRGILKPCYDTLTISFSLVLQNLHNIYFCLCSWNFKLLVLHSPNILKTLFCIHCSSP